MDRHQRLGQVRIPGGSARTLELDGLRIGTGLGERVHEPQRVRAPQRLRPDVRRDDRNGDPVFPPLPCLPADRTNHPAVELDMQSGLIDQRDDVARADHPVRRVRPAHEGLDPRKLAGRDHDLRLVVQGQGAGLERLLQVRAS